MRQLFLSRRLRAAAPRDEASGLALVLLALVALLARVAPPAAGGECAGTPHPSWKASIAVPDDPFQVYPPGTNPGWVKFTILLCDPERVYFQDSNAYPFHHDFAAAHLDPFGGISRAAFDAATLHAAGQQAVLGAVLVPPYAGGPRPDEYGIQLVRRDPYSVEEVASLFETVRSSLEASPAARGFYFPTFEQAASAEANRVLLAARGIEVGSPARWSQGDICYANGWALGILKFFAAGEIDAAYRDGRLRPSDILLTDGIPAEVPFVAGIISLVPATPNAHVAILARSYGVPFVHLTRAADRERALQLAGRRVVLRAHAGFESCDVRLLDVEETLDEETVAEILDLKALPPLAIAPMAAFGALAAPTAGLRITDIRHAGGKAANYHFLEQTIPQNARPALAFTFDLWNAFLDQSLAGGGTLRGAIAARLSPHGAYPPASVAALAAELEAVRDLIRDEDRTRFSPALQTAVIAALRDPRFGWDPAVRLRFRSSTNVEDSDQFTGAGLYDSFSGCLADDLDGDASGPSLCDLGETGERGVFRALRRVFASFYNDNAFLERRRWGVDETTVGMAVLVHPSFPDETELANGVATLRWGPSSHELLLVTQVGAISVTNPTDGSLPEEVEAFAFGESVFFSLRRGSNLLPLGATVLAWESDYRELARLLRRVGDAFAAETGLARFLLDFEYKKIAPGGLLTVKQVRRIPEPDTTAPITPFLVNEPLEYCTFQGEASNVFSNHRLKSRWSLETRNMWLTPENLAAGLYTRIEAEHTDGCAVGAFGGDPAGLAGFEHRFDGESVRDRFRAGAPASGRVYTLVTGGIPTVVSPSQSAILTQRDFFVRELEAEHDGPVLVPGFEPGKMTWTRNESASLAVCPEPQDGDLLQQRSAADESGVAFDIQFYWPPPPRGVVAGYTAPLARWVGTTITGLGAEPVLLTGEYSQTYRPEHHNFSENFIFAPLLEPGLSAAARAELEARDIHLIQVFVGDLAPRVTYHGACGVGHGCACGAAFRRGDCDGDGRVSGLVTDAIFLLGYLFLGGPAPPCRAACDADGDGQVAGSVTDAVYLLGFNFLGGPPPPAPYPGCGGGTPGDAVLGCVTVPAGCE